MSKRILFVDHSAELGGAELSLLDIARHFAAHSEVALLADGPFRKLLEDAHVPTSVFPLSASARGVRRDGGIPGALAILSFARIAVNIASRARRFNVLYANSQKAFVVAAFASILARRPLIWHLRDILTSEHFTAASIRTVVMLANLCADRVITNSEATAAAFRARGGRAALVRVVHNGIDAAPFTDPSIDTRAVRESLGVGSAPLVGCFSRLAPWKGQHVLLDALASLPGVHALVVGEALFGEHVYATDLKHRAERLGLADRVHFLGFRSDVPSLMCATDVVAHTSVGAEPFGRVIVEGMLAGVPIVATRGGGALEILRDGVTGVLVSPGSVPELACAISEVMRTSKGAEMSMAARRDATARFSLQKLFGSIGPIVEELA